MKKANKIVSALLVGMLGVSSLAAFAGCDKDYELSAYTGGDRDENGKMIYNTELFYSNSVKQGFPDPQVLDDTANTGYYYLFGTSGSFHTMRSKNLAEWEDVGPTFFQRQSEEVKKATKDCLWAPEVVYDAKANNGKGLYYMFCSATPDGDASVKVGKGVVSDCTLYNMYVATSEHPAGPYIMVDFTGKHSYNTTANKVLADMTAADEMTAKYAWVKEGNTYYEAAFPHYYAKYCLFSPDDLYKFNQAQGITHSEGMSGGGYFGNIDPHPFVDKDGNKWLYCNISRPQGIMVVKMTDWLTPDWSEAEIITMDRYYTMEDWREDQKNGNDLNSGVSYEEWSCNEGPHVIYHEDQNGRGLYYLTFSVNDYATSKYSVATAVSENPKGPFRKLREEEGALLLCSTTTESETVSGAGHHSFITREGISYIIYHRHTDYLKGGADRYTAMDEMQWITVKDIDGNDMDVPYTNGPTDSMQPLPFWFSGYKNIAGEAEVSAEKETELEYLTDGLLSVHKTADEEFMSYIGETVISETTTFAFDFETARTLRAVMVYNSAFEDRAFLNISRMEFTLADGSVRVISDVKFDTEQYCSMLEDRITYIKSGSAAFAEFYDVEVKSLKITVEVPKGQDEVGISEIRILGKV